MDNTINSSRWYDGFLYSISMDAMVGKSFVKTISGYITDNSSVLDIGCGVGSVVMGLSVKCGHVTGMDLSDKMVTYARKRLAAASVDNAEILHGSAVDLLPGMARTYDYAVMTQFLHEISGDARDRIMEQAKKVAREFIIADFTAPYPDTPSGRIIRFLEMAAGKEHYTNFRDWLEKGGLDGLLGRHDLAIVEERIYSTGVGKIVKAKAR